MDETKMVIESAIQGGDELVFVYEKEAGDETKMLTRFVRPIEIKTATTLAMETTVLCLQILPKLGFRRFKLRKIKSAYRVATRQSFSVPQ